MYKKIFQLSLITLLLLANISLVSADSEEFNTCYNGCFSSYGTTEEDASRRDRNACRDFCEEQVNPTEEERTGPTLEDYIACENSCKSCSSFEFSARNDATSSELATAKEAACQRECRANPSFSCNTLPPIPKPDNLPGPDIGINPTGDDVLDYVSDRVLPKLANRLISIIAVITIIMLVISGVMMIAATGNEDQLKKARQTALFASLGLGLALMSFAIVAIINSLNLST